MNIDVKDGYMDEKEAKEFGRLTNNFSRANKIEAERKERRKHRIQRQTKAEKEEARQLLAATVHGDLLPVEEKKERVYNSEQLRLIEIKRKHWLQFVWALPFRVWEKITGELPQVPPPGTFAVNGWPKTGTTPWEYVANSFELKVPFTKHEHAIAYAVIAELYTLAGHAGPGKKINHPLTALKNVEAGKEGDEIWQALLLDADALVQKWVAKDDFAALSFPDALKKARLDKRMSQGNVADLIGFQDLAVSRWERGEYEPSAQAIYELNKELPLLKEWFKYNPNWVKDHGAVI